MSIKQELYNRCAAYVQQRLATIEATISSNKKALESETKSSAGDKHETGRAMLQLEMEKAGKQLASIQQLQEVLAKIDVESASEIARLGSVIYTNNINYFLAISCGKLTIEDETFFAISVSSPIGKLLLGKQKGDRFSFNGNSVEIRSIR